MISVPIFMNLQFTSVSVQSLLGQQRQDVAHLHSFHPENRRTAEAVHAELHITMSRLVYVVRRNAITTVVIV